MELWLKRKLNKLRIIAISDTHELHQHVSVPDGDILIHCGDWTNKGSPGAMEKFLDWFSAQPHKEKVMIAGNHELSLEGAGRHKALKLISKYTGDHLHFLENSSVKINGLNFYGSPATPFFFAWAFNFQRGKDIAREWAKIPDDVDVLITHGPSYGVLDNVEDNLSNMGRDLHQGCEDLAKRIKELKNLKLHLCGHLHTDGGQQVINDGIISANAAICTERYSPTNKPVIIDL